MSKQEMTNDIRMTMELTGLSYADWEQAAIRLQQVAARSSASGLLDDRNLEQAKGIEASIDDEIAIVEDMGSLVDPETAGEIAGIRNRLTALRDRVHGALRTMSRVAARSP